MTAPLLDRTDRLKQRLNHLLDAHRATINRASDIRATLKIDGKKIVQPWFDDLESEAGPSSLEDIDRDILQALGEASGPLTLDALHVAVGCARSSLTYKGRMQRLTVAGLVEKTTRGYQITERGREA